MADAPKGKFVATGVIGLILLITTVVWNWTSRSTLQQAPDIVLHIIDGRQINLHSLKGKPTVVTFWATTCETCVKKTPQLKALYQKLKPRGLELIAVAMAYDPPNRILAFSKENNIPYPIALDIDGAVARAFDDVTLTPTTFLIGPGGKILFSKIGNFDINDLEEKISKLLAEPYPVSHNETS